MKIIESIPPERPIIFAPDQHLGRYLIKKTGRSLVLWPGSCVVHETFDAGRIAQMKARYPEAVVLAHPECPEAVLGLADQIGSTNALLAYAAKSQAKEFIVVTESGIIHQMKKACPEKTFRAAANKEGESCGAAHCPYMRRNSLEKVYQCLLQETPEVLVPWETAQKALFPLQRMLELS